MRREDADARAVRLAARRTAWWVAAVSAGIVLGALGLAALFVVHQSQPSELLEPAKPGQAKIYVDSHEVLAALAVVGAVAVGVLGVAAWRISRRSVAELGAALRLQRSFVADASHELRTPLAVLDTRLQVLQGRLERGEPLTDGVAAARRDVGRMSELVADLLLVAERSATADGCDLRPVVLDAVDDLRALAADHGVRLAVDVANEARVPLPETGLRRALVVLIDNAVLHSPEGAEVRVEAAVLRGRAVVRVRDHGRGIRGVPEGALFERFAHGEPSGRRRGSGLGLALTRDLAVRHGGDLRVESTSTAGTVMRLELPASR